MKCKSVSRKRGEKITNQYLRKLADEGWSLFQAWTLHGEDGAYKNGTCYTFVKHE